MSAAVCVTCCCLFKMATSAAAHERRRPCRRRCRERRRMSGRCCAARARLLRCRGSLRHAVGCGVICRRHATHGHAACRLPTSRMSCRITLRTTCPHESTGEVVHATHVGAALSKARARCRCHMFMRRRYRLLYVTASPATARQRSR